MLGKIASEPGPNKLISLLENYGKAATLFSGILLALSVFYDYNFLKALRLTFADVPTTIADHVRTAILWLPSTLVASFAILLLALLLRRFSQTWFLFGIGFIPENKEEDSQLSEKTNPHHDADRPRSRVRQFTAIAAICTVSFLAVAFVSITEWDLVYKIFIPVWLSISFWLRQPLRPLLEKIGAGELGMLLFVVVPLVFAYIGEAGYSDGRDMARLSIYEVGREVQIKTVTGIQSCKLLGFRRFSTVAILVGQDRKVTLLPTDSVLQMRQVYGMKYDSNDSCPRKISD